MNKDYTESFRIHLWLASGCLQDTLGTGGEDLSNVGHFQGDS